ncbi:hypothetical protein EVAR_86296_1 [Eumeta japonica]|uniref:Uncharacterized protein n=1 Tax=Eumeta variegata TaxID=151549 RepID=A0A4C1X707_EUMVA|nr:hypothetical protein EVAR_86296_1 [Eumeta japonica]
MKRLLDVMSEAVLAALDPESGITIDEIMKALKRMKVGKAAGYDRVSSEILRGAGGELVVGAAHNAVLLTPLSERDRGRLGSLFVTNYKLAFVPLDNSPADEPYQRNSLVGAFEVPLSAVGALWLTDAGPARRRRLLPHAQMPSKVKGLQVICKAGRRAGAGTGPGSESKARPEPKFRTGLRSKTSGGIKTVTGIEIEMMLGLKLTLIVRKEKKIYVQAGAAAGGNYTGESFTKKCRDNVCWAS